MNKIYVYQVVVEVRLRPIWGGHMECNGIGRIGEMFAFIEDTMFMITTDKK